MTQIDTDKLKKKVHLWAEAYGRKDAQLKLQRYGISFSLAYLLTTGTYISEPKDKVIAAIKKAMGNAYLHE